MSGVDPNARPRGHFAPFRESSRPWLVLARNIIPIIGVWGLGWSANVAVFQIWFDGATALGAMLALHLRAFSLTNPKAQLPASIPPEIGGRAKLIAFLLMWLVVFALLGIPYWFALFFFSATLFREGFWSAELGHPAVLVALFWALLSNILEESKRGYERMSAAETRLEFNWDFSIHLARIGALLVTAFFFGKFIIIPLALALSYIEIYPMRALRLMGGDRTLEAENENRSRD